MSCRLMLFFFWPYICTLFSHNHNLFSKKDSCDTSTNDMREAIQQAEQSRAKEDMVEYGYRRGFHNF